MNLTTGVSVGVLVLIAISGGIFVSMGNKDDVIAEKAKMEQTAMEEQKMIEEKTMMEKKAMEEKGAIVKSDTVEVSSMEEKSDTMVKSEKSSMMEKEDVMVKAGSYEAYAPEKIALASASHAVVLFFRASWCPSCRAIDADIKANLGDIPASLSILDVNYDDATGLKQKYGVTYQHTFVQVDESGTLIKKWSGSPTLTALVSEVQ